LGTFLDCFEKYGKGKVDLNIYYPDVKEEDKIKAQELGIPAIQFNVIAKDEFQLKQGWLGLSVSVLGENEGEDEPGINPIEDSSSKFDLIFFLICPWLKIRPTTKLIATAKNTANPSNEPLTGLKER